MVSSAKALPGHGTSVSVGEEMRNKSSFCLLFLSRERSVQFSSAETIPGRDGKKYSRPGAKQKFFLPTFSFKKKYGLLRKVQGG